MKEWEGKSWDYIIFKMGSKQITTRWTDFQRWTDFPNGRWLNIEAIKFFISFGDLRHKFFWWWLRFGSFVWLRGMIRIPIKLSLKVIIFLRNVAKILIKEKTILRAFYNLKFLGKVLIKGQIELITRLFEQILGKLLVKEKVSLKVLYSLFQVLGRVLVRGLTTLKTFYKVKIYGNNKINGSVCCSQYFVWTRFATWQDWVQATGGKWYFQC